ncbi:hypothetical protein FE257_004399 [Aspergillus nanangensis]|uniref:NAD(P)-binding protein n=1 Tax=Aspergillus nanangensis TaxID=2582783 RepID=A0AAD4H0J6_ASPNN|nr:hypothetical protein FE257_004399 [Aspergillus nanangensis]
MTGLRDLPNITFLTLDVTNSSHIATAVDTVSNATGGTLNYLINNAGHNRYMPVLDEDLDEAKELFDTNVWGSLAVTKAFAPLVIKARGTIGFIASIAGHVNVPYMGVYGASKSSQEIIADTLRLELAPFHVKVLSIVTGAVGTRGQSYFGDWKLPADSLYKSIEGTIHARAQWDDGVTRMDVMTYADKVVERFTGGSTGKVWYGGSAGIIKFLLGYMPTWILDKMFVYGTGLDKVGSKSQ